MIDPMPHPDCKAPHYSNTDFEVLLKRSKELRKLEPIIKALLESANEMREIFWTNQKAQELQPRRGSR